MFAVHYPVERGHQEILLPQGWPWFAATLRCPSNSHMNAGFKISQQKFCPEHHTASKGSPHFHPADISSPDEAWLIRPGHLLSLSHGPVLMSIVGPFSSGQKSVWTLSPVCSYTTSCDVSYHSSIRFIFAVFAVAALLRDWFLAVHDSVSGPPVVLPWTTFGDHCTPVTPNNICCFWDAPIQFLQPKTVCQSLSNSQHAAHFSCFQLKFQELTVHLLSDISHPRQDNQCYLLHMLVF